MPAAKTANPGTKTRPVHAAVKKRRAQPIPSRPTNRIFTGCLLLAVFLLPCYGFWSSYLRYPARGIVRGRVVRISAPWQGIVDALHVREGDEVVQGQPIVTLRKLELEHQLDSINDQLRVAQAELRAQATQLVWQSELRGDRSYKAWGEYYEAWGNLMQERAILDQVVADRDRHEGLRKQAAMAVSDRQLDDARFAVTGQRDKVGKLEQAVKKLEERAKLYEKRGDDVTAQMTPQLTSIETLQSELGRLRQRAQEGVIRSPVNGTVVRLHRFAGEVATPLEPAIEIVEDGSLEVAVYLSQRHAKQVELGSEFQVTIEPNDQTMACVVQRLGRRLEPAPDHIERHYAHNARLLPVIARPTHSLDHVYLGSEVKLSWPNFFWPRRTSKEESARRGASDVPDTPTATSAAPLLSQGQEETL